MGEYFGPELSEPDPGSCYYPALRQGPDQPAKYSKSKAYLQVNKYNIYAGRLFVPLFSRNNTSFCSEAVEFLLSIQLNFLCGESRIMGCIKIKLACFPV